MAHKMKLKIAGRKFSVKFQRPRNMGQNFPQAGRVVCDLQKIWIDKTNAKGRQREVLLHEIIHAVDFLCAAGLSENQTHALASGIMAVLVDNPKAADFILGR